MDLHLHDAWVNMSHLGLPVAEKIIRAVVVYMFLLLGLRLAGKRELAQLNPFDLIVLLLLSNVVQNAIIGDDNSVTGGMIGAAALLSVNYIIVRMVRGNRRLARLLEGRPDILIKDGEIQKDHLNRELISKAELVAAAHKQGIGSLHDVEHCVLEPTGTISFVLRRPTHDSARHNELVSLINAITEEVKALRAATKAVEKTERAGEIASG